MNYWLLKIRSGGSMADRTVSNEKLTNGGLLLGSSEFSAVSSIKGAKRC